MGASGSSTSQNAATVAQQYGMPILSWAASSPLLSDKRFYPTFMRVCHSDSSQSIAMAWISKYTFGKTRELTGLRGDAAQPQRQGAPLGRQESASWAWCESGGRLLTSFACAVGHCARGEVGIG